MPRPIKPRKIGFIPTYNYFVPHGVKKCNLLHVSIKLEELEAMRLKDILNLSQEECAKEMNVSRQTFQLILDSARKKITESLIEGKAIKIEGGNYTRNICIYKCTNCGNTFENKIEEKIDKCPSCESTEIKCHKKKQCCMKHRCKI